MKALYLCVMVAFVVSPAASPSAVAGTQDGAVLALHVKAHTTKATTLCTTWKPTVSCDQYNTGWPINSAADVYLVVAKAPDTVKGIAGVSCGIDYNAAPGDGVDVSDWQLCADMEYTNAGPHGEWPAAGGGNRIVWLRDTNCQRTVIGADGVHAVAGAFYLYAYGQDQFHVTQNLNLQIPELAVADCNASTTYLPMDGYATGWVGFSEGSDPGCNPCVEWCGGCIFGTPIRRTTWGGIKQKY